MLLSAIKSPSVYPMDTALRRALRTDHPGRSGHTHYIARLLHIATSGTWLELICAHVGWQFCCLTIWAVMLVSLKMF